MSNLIGSLLTNANALNVHSLGAEVAGRNIANVNDPNYARQRVVLREGGDLRSGTRLQALGVEALGVEHIRNDILDMQILNEKMKSASLETESVLLKDLESVINDIIDRQELVDTLNGQGSPNLEGGLSAAIDDTLNSFAELASNPTSEEIKRTIFENAERVIDQFNLANERLLDLEDYIADQVEADVDDANDLLKHIASLNGRIARQEIQKGMTATSLRDERQEAMEKLAMLIDYEKEVSSIDPSMIDIKVHTVNAGGAINIKKIVIGANANGEFFFDEKDEATGNTINKLIFRQEGTDSAQDVTVNHKGGSIHGGISAKDVALLEVKAGFDTLAKEFVEEVNTAYQGTTTSPGGQDLTNKIFDSTKLTSATIALDSSLYTATVITTASGGTQTINQLDVNKLKTTNDLGQATADLALAIGELVEKKVINASATDPNQGFEFREFVAFMGASVGAEAQSIEQDLEAQDVLESFLEEQRQSYSGVSIDEEMTDLLRFQRTFQGTSRVISVLDNMLQEVVTGLVR